MRLFYVLPMLLVFGCAAGQRGAAEPEVPWSTFQADQIEISAPPNWSQRLQRSGQPAADKNYSVISLRREDGRSVTVFHPHGDAAFARKVLMAGFLRTAMLAAVVEQRPEIGERMQLKSITVEPVRSLDGEDTSSVVYQVRIVKKDDTELVNTTLLLVLQPTDENTTVLAVTDVPPAEGELFPAEVLAIVRTVEHKPPEAPAETE